MMKTMKYYLKNIFLAASCLWLFTACNDFLTLYPEDDIVDDEYWETGEDVQSVVASCYRFMLEDNVISRIIYWGEARSDNMDYSTSASTNEQYLKDANLLSSNGLVTWGDFYKVINICNKVIKSAPAVRDREPTLPKNAYTIIWRRFILCAHSVISIWYAVLATCLM